MVARAKSQGEAPLEKTKWRFSVFATSFFEVAFSNLRILNYITQGLRRSPLRASISSHGSFSPFANHEPTPPRAFRCEGERIATTRTTHLDHDEPATRTQGTRARAHQQACAALQVHHSVRKKWQHIHGDRLEGARCHRHALTDTSSRQRGAAGHDDL